MEVWTLSFATGNAVNEFWSFAQKAVVALEEVKTCLLQRLLYEKI